jgi:hypothetical protein
MVSFGSFWVLFFFLCGIILSTISDFAPASIPFLRRRRLENGAPPAHSLHSGKEKNLMTFG